MKLRKYFVAAVLAAIGTSISMQCSRGDSPTEAELVPLPGVVLTSYEITDMREDPPADTDGVRLVGDAEAAGEFYGSTSIVTDHPSSEATQRNSLRWLGAVSSEPTSRPASKQQKQQEVFVGMPEVVQLTTQPESFDSRISQPSAIAAPSQRPIIRVQASEADEDIFYSAMRLPDEAAVAKTVEEVAAEPTAAPEPSYVENGPIPAWGEPTIGCDTCCGGPACGCRRCRRRCLLVGGVDAVFLDIDTNGTRPSFTFDDDFTPGRYHYAPGADLVPDAHLDDFYMAPRIWAGVQGCCWGVVGRYFHLRAGEHDSDLFIPVPTHAGIDQQGFDAYSVFEAYYADLELTRNFCCCGTKNQFSFGARYALIDHAEGVTVMSNVPAAGGVPGGLINGGARSKRNAHGTGLTFGLNGRKPLFCNSCAHWFYNVRGSVLWGCTHNEVETWAEVIGDTGTTVFNAGSKDGAASRTNDDLFIGEVQLGLQWDFAMRCLPAKSFFRAAFEYQYWDSSIGNAASGSFAGFSNTNGTFQGSALAFAPGIRADLVGFHVGTGFTW